VLVSMPIEPIEVHLKGVKDRNEKDNSETGYHFGLSLSETLPYPIKDMVVQDIEVNKTRGCHYHPSAGGKVEIFVPLKGQAELEWHETESPKEKGHASMLGFFDQPDADSLLIFKVSPNTCHRVRATTPFQMLSLNNMTYAGKGKDARPCEHGFC
jgi:oxalate decarboxylase/phosphoglucose isomerase-like protein (cupin superfamily)